MRLLERAASLLGIDVAVKDDTPFACRGARLTAEQLNCVERSLTNPDIRVPLRADLPDLISVGDADRFLAVVEAELAKCGENLNTVGEINFAYPNKDPRLFPKHSNFKGEFALEHIWRQLLAAHRKKYGCRLPAATRKATMISETAYLDRSHHQDSLHALTRRQQYVVRKLKNSAVMPFLSADHASKKHFFIIVDQWVEQGTTVANLASYITHNGGHVLCVAQIGREEGRLVPQNTFSRFEGEHKNLKGVFGAAANNRALPALGFFLQQAAARESLTLDRDQALAAVESSINRCGHSLTALTHVETQRLIQLLQTGHLRYSELVDKTLPRAAKTISQQPRKVMA